MSERDDLIEQAFHAPTVRGKHRPIRVFGLDTSLSNTGVAGFFEGNETPWLAFVTSAPSDQSLEGDLDRIVRMASDIYRKVVGQVHDGDDVWVIFEGPAPHAKNGKPDERAGLRWHLAIAFRRLGYRIIFMVPSTNKKYWTDNGAADKPLMLAWAKRRYPTLFIRDHNIADALSLAHTGARVRGLLPTPVPPEVNMTALDGVVWPKPQEAH